MNPKIPERLILLLILLPGFVSIGVSSYFSDQPQLAGEVLFAAALAFTLVDIAVVLAGIRLIAFVTKTTPPRFDLLISSEMFFIVLAATSVCVGLAWSWVDSNDILFKMRITQKVSRATVWQKAFRDSRTACDTCDTPEECSKSCIYAAVHLSDGRIYHGSVQLNSTGDDEAAIYLNPAWLDASGVAGKSFGIRLKHNVRSECIVIPEGVFLSARTIALVEFESAEDFDMKCKG